MKYLKDYPAGDYKTIFQFWSGGRIYGEKIIAIIRIKQRDIKKNVNDEYIDKINEFRETFNLSQDEYSYEKILDIFKDNDFNYENAFSSLFNQDYLSFKNNYYLLKYLIINFYYLLSIK